MTIDYEWRGDFGDDEVDALHAEGFNHPLVSGDWLNRVRRHSLGWVCARDAGGLVGFVNVAWDGGVHAFLLDTVVAGSHRGAGVGAGLVAEAARRARRPNAPGCTPTSRTTCARSTSTPAASGRLRRASSPSEPRASPKPRGVSPRLAETPWGFPASLRNPWGFPARARRPCAR